MDGTMANVTLFAGNFAPRSWAFCHGQLMPISSNSALFSLVGTIFGGDGRSSFGLPELRSRVPIGAGQGPGLGNRPLGHSFGTEFSTLNALNMPPHNHPVTISDSGGVDIPVNTEAGDEDETSPGVGVLANTGASSYASTPTVNAKYSANPIPVTGMKIDTGVVGVGQSFENLQPSLGMNYIICLQGVFPSRS